MIHTILVRKQASAVTIRVGNVTATVGVIGASETGALLSIDTTSGVSVTHDDVVRLTGPEVGNGKPASRRSAKNKESPPDA